MLTPDQVRRDSIRRLRNDTGIRVDVRGGTIEVNRKPIALAGKTPEERADQLVARAAALADRLDKGLDANRTYLDLAAPTAPQTAAQVKALTRQMTALIRLARASLGGSD